MAMGQKSKPPFSASAKRSVGKAGLLKGSIHFAQPFETWLAFFSHQNKVGNQHLQVAMFRGIM